MATTGEVKAKKRQSPLRQALLRRLPGLWAVRTQVLLDQLQQARAFNPTLMDARFFIQVGTSMTGIMLANIFLRQLLS